jgi:mannose-6-phosphate isomerase-like protein (cupin superfamily)
MDLHILKPECGIGIHRHRDNQEIFFLLSGTGIMVMGDWLSSRRGSAASRFAR